MARRAWLLLSLCAVFAPAATSTRIPAFESDILPIFRAKCIACHGAASPQQALDMRSLESLLKGGKSGPAIRLGSSTKSLLMEKIITGQMPPTNPKLSGAEVESIRTWIDKTAPAEIAAPVTEQDVLPIFQARCVVCHGKREQQGGLDLRFQAARLKGGKSGPALVPGKPDESLLIRKIESGDMPPVALQGKFSIRAPSEAEMQTLRKWIAAGCPPPPVTTAAAAPALSEKFWSFQQPKRPAIPTVRRQDLARNPIDAFLLQKLEAKSLSYSPEADPLVLLRRVTLDLTGVPPAPADVRSFLDDRRPDRYERLVDKLLDSPQYGERWARHWLDLAGYGDTEGFGLGAPLRPQFWRYRDYLIRAFNSDKPYNQFLMEQIAGDELADYKGAKVTQDLIDRLAATGFLRAAPDSTWEAEFAFLSERIDVIADQISILTSSVMGLTIGCARCHDHKYDPISQRDYYRLSAILQAAYDPYDWRPPKERNVEIALESDVKEAEELNAPLNSQLAKLNQTLEENAKPYREKLTAERIGALPEVVRKDLIDAEKIPEKDRTATQKYLVEKVKKGLETSTNELAKKYPEFKTASDPIMKEISETRRKLRPKPHVRALVDMGGQPSAAYLLRRGDPLSPAEPVDPGVPPALSAGLEPYKAAEPWPGANTTGRRLALARWLTQPNHPLTARVLVNQLWLRHFGRGIVATPGNFGKSGAAPSHPELLDWLSTEFVSGGWSMKRMHRLMVTSAAYRQSSRQDPTQATADPENALLSRMTIRRMDADQLYDSILAVTGRLNQARFGPPEDIVGDEGKEIVAQGSKQGFRRSVYVMQKMSSPVTLLEAFDLPQMTPNCIERSRSNVATQALQMMNSARMWELSRYMAGRVIDEAGQDPKRQVESTFLRALSRAPSEDGLRDSLAALEEMNGHWASRLKEDRDAAPVAESARWMSVASLCHTVLNSAGFLFID